MTQYSVRKYPDDGIVYNYQTHHGLQLLRLYKTFIEKIYIRIHSQARSRRMTGVQTLSKSILKRTS